MRNTNRSPQENADLDWSDKQVDKIPEMLMDLRGWDGDESRDDDDGIDENDGNDSN